MKGRGAVLAWGAIAVGVSSGGLVLAVREGSVVPCGEGFRFTGTRCCAGLSADPNVCGAPVKCPAPLVLVGPGCDAPDRRVRVPETTLVVGSSDWEADGRVSPRTVHVWPFEIDAFEGTLGRLSGGSGDRARAASRVSRDDATRFCRERGGRLPTEDEWLAAAAGPGGRRYPWGDTGAVCRRAAWGLARGPCATAGAGPDTVGSHPDGDTPSGIHDMAGNVAEWVLVDSAPGFGVARGGAWSDDRAADLRTWARVEVPVTAHDPRIGVRCAYDLERGK